jgi:hypothetical protein
MYGAGPSVVKETRSVGEIGRCIAPCLFNLCKLIDKFQNLLFYCFIASINIGMNMSTFAYIDVYQLVMI